MVKLRATSGLSTGHDQSACADSYKPSAVTGTSYCTFQLMVTDIMHRFRLMRLVLQSGDPLDAKESGRLDSNRSDFSESGAATCTQLRLTWVPAFTDACVQ
jgi:hypothetical protein